MNHYEENGINNYIASHKINGFSLFDNSRSLLVIYNTSKNEPVMVVLDERYENNNSIENPDDYEKTLTALAINLASSLNVNLLIIKYLNSYETFNNTSRIWVWTDEQPIEKAFTQNTYYNADGLLKTMERLVNGKSTIKRYNNNKSPAKKENDALSSAFHLWTRKNVGIGAFVDIDLIRYNGSKITEIIELKRSFYELKKWKPFNNDFNNYSALADIAARINVPLILLYNKQSEYPITSVDHKYQVKTIKQKTGTIVYDIIDRVIAFRVYNSNIGYMFNVGLPCLLGECTLEDFLLLPYTTDVFLTSSILTQKNNSFIKRMRNLYGYLCSYNNDPDPVFTELLHTSIMANNTLQEIVDTKDADVLISKTESILPVFESIQNKIEYIFKNEYITNQGFNSILQETNSIIMILNRIIELKSTYLSLNEEMF